MKALFIVLSLAMLMAFLEGLAAGTEELVRQEQQSKATFYANIIAHCLNGQSLQVADHVVDCVPRKSNLRKVSQ